MAVYTDDDAAEAPLGHVRFASTDVEVVAYAINPRNLCLLVNKGEQCIYRATLVGALDPKVRPLLSPLAQDSFLVRDLATTRAQENT